MISRCYDTRDPSYANYGGRGIEVCDEWFEDYASFLLDMGGKPSPEHTLGRIDNDGDYEPDNVRWETWTEQQNNRRSSVRVTANGKTQTLAQWAAEMGIKRQLIQTRKTDGWAIEVAVSTPAGVRKADAHRLAGLEPGVNVRAAGDRLRRAERRAARKKPPRRRAPKEIRS